MTKGIRICHECGDDSDKELFESTFDSEIYTTLFYYFLPEKTFEFYTKQLTPETKADERIIGLLKEFVVVDEF